MRVIAFEIGYGPTLIFDSTGKSLMPMVYGMTGYSGRAIVKKNGKYGIIDETGKELFYTNYGRIDRFYNDYAIVYTKPENGEIKVGIIDKNGDIIINILLD